MSAIDEHWELLEASPDSKGRRIVKRGTDGLIDYIIVDIKRHRLHAPQLESNALLIAAAPDLLAALRDMADCLEVEIACGDAFPYTAKLTEARKAIAKAKEGQ